MHEIRRIRLNRRLYTKDGRRIGNALATGCTISPIGVLYTVITDYGNTLKLTYKEVHKLFYLGTRAGKDHKNYVRTK